MSSPDSAQLVRLLSGESVFGLDIDSKILQAANEVSGRVMFELFKICDTSNPDWAEDFADELMSMSTGGLGSLIGFDDGRWQGLDSDGSEFPDGLSSHVQYLKLEFVDVDACFYQFHLFPSFNEPFLLSCARKRADNFQYVCIEVAHSDDVQVFIQNLRGNPHLTKIHESSEEEFALAPSHSPG